MYVFESFGELHFPPTFDAGTVRHCITKEQYKAIVWLGGTHEDSGLGWL